MDFSNCRIIIVDTDGNIFPYEWEIGEQHQSCLNKFASEHYYEFSNIDDIVKKNNSIFYGYYAGGYSLFLAQERNEHHNEVLLDIIKDISINRIKKYENGFINATIQDDIMTFNKRKK